MLPIGTQGTLNVNSETSFMCIAGRKCRVEDTRPEHSEYLVKLLLNDGTESEDTYCVSATSFQEDGVRVKSVEPSKAIKAANALEDLLPHFRQIVNEIRSGHPQPYALLYEARTRLGRIITHGGLGAGVPSKSSYDWGDQ